MKQYIQVYRKTRIAIRSKLGNILLAGVTDNSLYLLLTEERIGSPVSQRVFLIWIKSYSVSVPMTGNTLKF